MRETATNRKLEVTIARTVEMKSQAKDSANEGRRWVDMRIYA